MSRLYFFKEAVDVVIHELKLRRVQGLAHEARPTDPDGQPSLWPNGVTDGNNFAWFEKPNMMLVWGGNDESKILERLRLAGFRVTSAE